MQEPYAVQYVSVYSAAQDALPLPFFCFMRTVGEFASFESGNEILRSKLSLCPFFYATFELVFEQRGPEERGRARREPTAITLLKEMMRLGPAQLASALTCVFIISQETVTWMRNSVLFYAA